jgi:hypothetical protein
MAADGAAAASRADRTADLPTLDLVVVPRWLRERRRAERLAARPDALAAQVARRVGFLTRPGRRRTVQELMREQGVEPFSQLEWRRREPMPDEEWEPFWSAIMEAKGR